MKKHSNKKHDKPKSNLDFKFMSFLFRIRDKRHDPMEKIEKAGIKPGDHVLDYGCGPGSFSIAAARVVGQSGKVYAADIHPLALKKVKEKALKEEVKNIETISTSCNTGLEDESIDVVICFDVLHGIKEKDSILNEFHRILKPNSILSFDDHHLEEDEIMSAITSTGLFKLAEKKDALYNFTKI